MRIAVCGVFHETNTFAPGITELDAFQEEWLEGDAFIQRYTGTRTSMGGVIEGAKLEQAVLLPGLYTYATPSGTVSDEAYLTIEQEIIRSLPERIDGLVVILHGAMVSDSWKDVEGQLLQVLANRLGADIPIAVTLDLHANISPAMVHYAHLIVGYDTYPHIDAYERALEAVSLLCRTLRKELQPTMAWGSAGMLVVPQAMLTDSFPMRQLMDEASDIQSDPKVLKVMVAGGFPYSDVPYAGMSFVVVTDRSVELAQTYVQRLQKLAWEIKDDFHITMLGVEEALEASYALPDGPIIWAEGSDNVGGGAPADGTHLLAPLLNASCTSLIVIRDREAAKSAYELGAGAIYEGHIGGKSDGLHGSPVRVKAKIKRISDGEYRHVGAYMTGQWAHMGRTAVLESGLLTMIVTEERSPPWDIGHVTSLGLNPSDYHIIVAKSAIAWKTAFGDSAKKSVDLNTPGCCSATLSCFEYRHLNRPIYPIDKSLVEAGGNCD